MPEWREMTEQTDWWAKQPPQVACFSEDLKCWEAWDTTCWHMPLHAGTKHRTSHYWLLGEERCGKTRHWTIFLERTRAGQHQSDEHWNHFRGNVGETSERQGGVHMGFSEPTDTTLNWTEPNRPGCESHSPEPMKLSMSWTVTSRWKPSVCGFFISCISAASRRRSVPAPTSNMVSWTHTTSPGAAASQSTRQQSNNTPVARKERKKKQCDWQISSNLHACMRECMCACMCECMHMYVHVCVRACMCACMCWTLLDAEVRENTCTHLHKFIQFFFMAM